MKKPYILLLVIIFISSQSKAKSTEWKGTRSSVWTDGSNWSNGAPVNGDDVSISVSRTYINAPMLAADISLASLTFGVMESTTTLTINSGVTLTVTGNITMQYSSKNVSAAINIQQTVSGTTGGTINCNGSFIIGTETAPDDPFALLNLIGYINNTNTVTVNIDLQNFTVNQNLTLRSASSGTANISGNTSVNVNNPVLNLDNGSLNVMGNIETVNKGGHVGYPGFTANLIIIPITTFPAVTPKAQLIVNRAGNVSGNSATLGIGGNITALPGDLIDLYGPGDGNSTTSYIGNNSAVKQPIYTTAATALDVSPSLYQNLIISGASPKTVQAGTITIAGDWTSAGGYIDAVTNSNTLFFQGTAQKLTDNGSHGGTGVIFNHVAFQGSGTKTISAGNFAVASTGILTMDDTASLITNGLLTLMSNASGTATVAALPKGTSISGNVNSQHFIKGSPADLSKRGYRLISSPVYTADINGVKCFDLKYLLDSAYVSGAAGGGFNTTGTNASLFLYREDVSAIGPNYTSGNWKGIANINNENAYDIGTQQRLTTTNVADTTINLPVGNGVLFYFRGNKTNNTTQNGTKFSAPYDYPEDVVFTQTGQLNMGTINVKQWYSSPSGFSYTYDSNVNNSTTRGFTFVGNPYPSAINFEKFNRQGAASSIYGDGLPAAADTVGKIWVYNATCKQYETYMQTPTVKSADDTTKTVRPAGCIYTGDATNMIASGQGFFIRVTTRGRGLSFKESAKTNTQPPSANINRIMNGPANNTLAFSSAAETTVTPILSVLGLRLIKDSINTDDAVLAFNSRTPTTYSEADDAEDMNGNGALVSLSIISSDNMVLAIKQQKLPQAGSQRTHLLVDAVSSGTYHLTLRNMDNMPGTYDVWLVDSLMNDSLDLKHNINYDFKIDKNNPATFGRNRFSVVVRLNPAAMMHPLSFAANKVMQGAQLSWHTENERNNFSFLVERSLDCKTFTQIGQVASNSSGNYAYTDVAPAKSINYYRIKLQDRVLNTISYSNILSLNYADTAHATVATNISVYPNPATSMVNIKVSTNNTDNNTYRIRISNSSGKVVRQITSSLPGLQTDVTRFMPGTYMVEVVKETDNKLQGQAKFVKL